MDSAQFSTLQQSEAMAEAKSSLVRDRVVRLLQGRAVRGREAGEAGDPGVLVIANCNGSLIMQEVFSEWPYDES